MNRCFLLLVVVLVASCFSARASGVSASVHAKAFAPGTISGASPAFTPDGKTVYFMNGSNGNMSIYVSHRVKGRWSKPKVAAFSRHWRNLDPAMSPDGSFVVFVSNRPAGEHGKPISMVRHGKTYTGKGMNLWRVNREGNGWGSPGRLPGYINRCNMVFAPTIAADGSIYFIGCSTAGGALILWRSRYRNGHYLKPAPVSLARPDVQIRDPAISPDESFMVLSIKKTGSKRPYRLAISFRENGHWTDPEYLGDKVSGANYGMGSRLGRPGYNTLYFYNRVGNNIWKLSLKPWLGNRNAGD